MPGYSVNDGWLLYTGDLGGRDITVCGEVSNIVIDVTSGCWSSTQIVDVRAKLSPANLTWETTDTHHTAGQALWYAIRDWPDRKKKRELPVELQALLDLARRHQAEYDELREALSILRALGG